MLVKMFVQIGGYRNGEAWPARGGLIEVPDHEAADLIANNYAERADAEQAPADDEPTADAEPDAAPVADDEPTADAEPVKPAKRTKS